MMNELMPSNGMIQVNYEGTQPTVSGRDLHAALEVKTAYKDWFPRMCEYGFIEGQDFCSNLSESTGGRPSTDHMLTIAMAKELCMIQRTEIGRKFRQYFIKVEEAWNTPEMVLHRANEILHRQLQSKIAEISKLGEALAIKDQQIAEMRPKVTYYDVVLQCRDVVPITVIAKDYGWSAKRMNQYLYEKRVQFKQGGKIWILYQKYAEMGYTQTRTYTYDEDRHCDVHTYWTQKGRLFIYNLLKADGILPVIERDGV